MVPNETGAGRSRLEHAASRRRVRRRRQLLGLVVVVFVAAGIVINAGNGRPATGTPADPAVSSTPYQYIAKAYTELLGRTPTSAEWHGAVAQLENAGCRRQSLTAFGMSIVSSPEYRSDYPPGNWPAITLTLYRFILNREPSAAEFVQVRDALRTGRVTPAEEASRLYSSGEFRTTTEPAICNRASPGYGFGQPGNQNAFPVIQTPASGTPGPDSPEATLQARLDAAGSHGGVVALPQRQVVALTTSLVVPSGVTLETSGTPSTNRYADMAHLVRTNGFTANDQLVLVAPGGKLVNMWVDGQRNAATPNRFGVFDVRMLGGTGTTVENDRLDNSFGASTLEADTAGVGVAGAQPCVSNVISDNLVENYASAHTIPPGQPSSGHPESDGLGIYCEDARVEHNDIVDITDAAIVLFVGAPSEQRAPAQLSAVEGNTIISAGNSMYWGIVVDPGFSLGSGHTPGGDPAGTYSRSLVAGNRQALVSDNQLWSGTRTHFDVVLASGTHALFGSVLHQDCLLPNPEGQAACGGGRNVLGGVWTGNSSGGQLLRTEMGIYVGGSIGATFTGNDFPTMAEVRGGGCPKHAVVVTAGTGPQTDFATHLTIDVPYYNDAASLSDHCVTPTY